MITIKYKIGLTFVSTLILANSALAQCTNKSNSDYPCRGKDKAIQLTSDNYDDSQVMIDLNNNINTLQGSANSYGRDTIILDEEPNILLNYSDDITINSKNTLLEADSTDVLVDNIGGLARKQLRTLKLSRSPVGFYPIERHSDRDL